MRPLCRGRSPITARALTDLPLPDSPTKARVVSLRRLKPTLSTARTDGREALTKSTVSCSTESKVVMAGLLLHDFGVQRIAQGVGEQGQGGHKKGHSQRGAQQLPPYADQ